MKIWPDCLPCILKMALGTARAVIKDEENIKRFVKEILNLKHLNCRWWDVTSPEIIKEVWYKLIEFVGRPDPMREIKDKQNKRALAIYPKVRDSIFKRRDPFLMALQLAIKGNSIDAMTNVEGEDPEEILKNFSPLEFHFEGVDVLKRRLERTYRLIYLGDNCGEIIFDRLLMEVLLERYPLKITFMTRTTPIMNDATFQDACSVGIGQVAQIIENGIQEPIPGTYLNKVNKETKRLIESADLILSKGGGNYDSLTEEEGLKGKVSFLFVAKCYPYCSLHQVSLMAPVIHNF